MYIAHTLTFNATIAIEWKLNVCFVTVYEFTITYIHRILIRSYGLNVVEHEARMLLIADHVSTIRMCVGIQMLSFIRLLFLFHLIWSLCSFNMNNNAAIDSIDSVSSSLWWSAQINECIQLKCQMIFIQLVYQINMIIVSD